MKVRSRTHLARTLAIGQECVRFPHQIFRYLRDLWKFWRVGGVIGSFWPILRDFDDQAGTARGHYFHQDLLVASFVHQRQPRRHIDVGSRVDGFVAHVASFREIEIVDVRPFHNPAHPQIRFLQKDMMSASIPEASLADSISCLHAIEHFGLGRYGEPINPEGHIRGFRNLIGMLEVGGFLYISFPVSSRNGVAFNAHRFFHPEDILSWPGCEDLLSLVRFDLVDDEGDLHKDLELAGPLPSVKYGCGIYTFVRIS